MISWVIYMAVGLIIGGVAGFFIGRIDDFTQREKQTMQEKLDEANSELARYKHEVTEHFVETAGLINAMTESYQSVHEHLAKGAQVLCDHEVVVDRLEVRKSQQAIPSTRPDQPGKVIEQVAELNHSLDQKAKDQDLPDQKTQDQTPQTQEPQVKEPEPDSSIEDSLIEVKTSTEHISSEAIKSNTDTTPTIEDADSIIVEDESSSTQKNEANSSEEEENAALSEKQAAAMASRMVH